MNVYRLKCNRGLPCDSCARRQRPSLCNYAANANRSKPPPSKGRDLKDRLNNLENLVSSFLSGDAVIQQPGLRTESEPAAAAAAAPEAGSEIITYSAIHYSRHKKQNSILGNPSGADNAFAPETLHRQDTGDGQINFVDPTHWLSILDDIKEVREHLSLPTQPVLQYDTNASGRCVALGSRILDNANPNDGVEEILSSLPSQPVCDMLLSYYFNSRFMILGKVTELLIVIVIQSISLTFETFVLRHYTPGQV
jgi:hypothetical protein